MKMLKYMIMQTVDVIFMFVVIGLLILHFVHGDDVSLMLAPLTGYIFFVIWNKAIIAMNADNQNLKK